MTSEIKEYIEQYKKFESQFNLLTDSLAKVNLTKENEELFNKINTNQFITKAREMLFREIFFEKNASIADSLITDPTLKELWLTSLYYTLFDHYRSPFSKSEKKKFDERIKNPFMRNVILTLNAEYDNINSKQMANEESLKNTEHLSNIFNPDELLNKLVEPYKGKVIYLDFWGTWCGPCRRNMQLMGPIKEPLKDKDVVFMYLANNSPEQTWKNIIKEMNLTGQNIVHYRLPDKQQQILEQRLAIYSWPTYMLIDKEGKIVNKNAPSPEKPDLLLKEIQQLLDK